MKALLNSETETETVERALALAEDYAEFEAEVNRGLASLVGRGGFVDRFTLTARLGELACTCWI